jgi:hypothetical protein
MTLIRPSSKQVRKNIHTDIPSQFPAIYREEGPIFVQFVEAYYKYVDEQENNFRDAFSIRDIDTTFERFLLYFKKKYLNSLPLKNEKDIRFLLKHIQDLYRRKGSTESIELLFRMFFDEEIEVFYPSYNILRISDSKYGSNNYLEMNPVRSIIDYPIRKGDKIIGDTSKAEAFVDEIVFQNIKGLIVPTLYLSNIFGRFTKDDNVRVLGVRDGVEIDVFPGELIHGSISSAPVNRGNRSSGNVVGDKLILKSNKFGIKATAAVSKVSEAATAVIDFQIADGGWGYSVAQDENIIQTSTVTQAFRLFSDDVFDSGYTPNGASSAFPNVGDYFISDDTYGAGTARYNTGESSLTGATNFGYGQVVGVDTENNLVFIEFESATHALITADSDLYQVTADQTKGFDVYFYDKGYKLSKLDILTDFSTYVNGGGGGNDAIMNLTGDGSNFFSREVTINGVRIVSAGSVGGQTAVPDAFIEKVARMFELFLDDSAAGINGTAQRNVIKTLRGDAGTYHASAGPTLQRVARGAGSDYTPNFLTDAGIASYNLSPLFDSHVANDMVWYLNSTGDPPGDGDNDAQEVIEHVFHTLHMHGLDAVSLKMYSYISADWNTGPLYNAMVEAYDGGFWDPSGYGGDAFKTDGDAFEVAAKEYLYLLNFCMFDYSSLWDGASLSPEWADSVKTPAGIQANLSLGYTLYNTYIGPVISKPSLATIRSIFQDGDVGDPTIAGASGWVVGGNVGQLQYFFEETVGSRQRFDITGTGSITAADYTALNDYLNAELTSASQRQWIKTNIVDYLLSNLDRIVGGRLRSGDNVNDAEWYWTAITDNNFINASEPHVNPGTGYPKSGYLTASSPFNNRAKYRIGSIKNAETVSFIPDIVGDFLDVQIVDQTYPSNPELTNYGMSGTGFENINTRIRDAFSPVTYNIGEIDSLVVIDNGELYQADVKSLITLPDIAQYDKRDVGVIFKDPRFIPSVGDVMEQTLSIEQFETGEFEEYTAKAKLLRREGDIFYFRPITFYTFVKDQPIKFRNSNFEVIQILRDESSKPLGQNALIDGEAQFARGQIEEINVLDTGFRYADGELIEIVGDEPLLDTVNADTGAAETITNPNYGKTVATSNIRVLGTGFTESDWLTTSSFLNDPTKVIHDNLYYQEYSFDVRSIISPDVYEDIVADVVQPAGTKLFGSPLINTTNYVNVELDASMEIYNFNYQTIAVEVLDVITDTVGYEEANVVIDELVATLQTLDEELSTTITEDIND